MRINVIIPFTLPFSALLDKNMRKLLYLCRQQTQVIMRAFFITLLSFLISLSAFSQISILGDAPITPKKEICPYDSMTNLKEMKDIDDNYGYRHLIGQTMMYCGDPWNYHYNSPNLPVGDYYLIKNVEVYKGSYIKNYCVFSLENTKTHQTSGFDCYASNYNAHWVVVGYYEKQKSKHIGREYVYRDFLGHGRTFDGLFSLDTDTVTIGIKDGSIWKCIDVSVKMRTSKEWKYEVNDHRSPVVLVLDNAEYGKHYCYIEDEFGSHFSIKNSVYKSAVDGLPLICGKFVDKIAYDKVIAANKQAKAKRLAELTRKFGSANAKMIVDGYIKIGMTKQMCRESWGEPDEINRTITSYGSSEQWCYGYSYVYFEGNKITAIQN